MRSQVSRETFCDAERSQVEKCVRTWIVPPHTHTHNHIHTSELGWNSFLSVAQPGSLHEESARPKKKNLWTSQARNLSRLCLIIKMCSVSNTSPLHAGCRRGRKCLGSPSWPGLSSDWLLSWSYPGVLSLGRRRSLHPEVLRDLRAT